jgi:adenine/guanine phosphoribosyltransferase-like PRPP-binding protein
MIYHTKDSFYGGDSYSLNDLDHEVEVAARVLDAHRAEFDGIAVRGMSGVIAGTGVSLITGIPMLVIRKSTEDCHAWSDLINGNLLVPGSRWIFFDDFVCEGDTRTAVTARIAEERGRVVGQYMTREHRLTLGDTLVTDGGVPKSQTKLFYWCQIDGACDPHTYQPI